MDLFLLYFYYLILLLFLNLSLHFLQNHSICWMCIRAPCLLMPSAHPFQLYPLSWLVDGPHHASWELRNGLCRVVVTAWLIRLGSSLFLGHDFSGILKRIIYAVLDSGTSFSWQECCRPLTASYLSVDCLCHQLASGHSLIITAQALPVGVKSL